MQENETGAADRNESANSGRDALGRFGPNNPGKPKGATHRSTRKAAALLAGEAEELSRVCIDMAKRGDTTALRLALERVLPARRPEGPRLKLAELEIAGTPAEQARAVLKAAARGEITVDAARQLLAAIADAVRVIEVDEILARLDALEKAGGSAR